MMNKLLAACIQTTSTPDMAANLSILEPMILNAAHQGARFITLPENVDAMIGDPTQRLAQTWDEIEHPAVAFFARLAHQTQTWILAGSLAIRDGAEKVFNRSYLFAADGSIAARYDKIHLFDATLSANEVYRESRLVRRGQKAILASTPWGKIGLSICYDLRFPHLYRALAKAGAVLLTVPAAFTATTGRMHWHVLLRARAIETGCFVVAPGQCGTHYNNRQTFGHSLIVAPSGEIIAEAGEMPGLIMAELDLDLVTRARQFLPSLDHDSPFSLP